MRLSIVFAMLLAVPGWALAQVTVVPPNPLPADGILPQAEQEGVETLTRGPIHEAFANPADPNPEPSPVVPQRPPQDVPEQPPEYQPEEGEHDWIPGYWEWDDERDEFLWVTGVWRQSPPDMRWVPGYWTEIDGGFQRVKGFWMTEQVDNVTYYQQAPPATLEAGPSSPSPADNYFWIPGNWNYADTGYAWQGGYWAPYQPDWVWAPARWAWTPAGYVFLPGHWDYRMASRGQIFAPVYFSNTVYTNPGWYYRPSVVIPTDNLFIYLWVRPRNNCYYFGNYFGPTYVSRGFVSWSNLHVHSRHGHHYDPFYSYCRVHYRQQGVDFVGRVQGWHRYYDQHPEHRPPSNWREQQQWLASRGDRDRDRDGDRNRDRDRDVTAGTHLVAHRLDDVSRRTNGSVRVKKVDAQTREEMTKHASRIRELDGERRRMEGEQAQNRGRPTASGDRDRDRDGDKSKSGSLVDRVEKTGRPDRPGTERPDRPNIADRGEKGEKGDRVDRGDRGDKGGKGAPGSENIAGTSPVTKLTLPKSDRPRLSSDGASANADRGKSGKSKAPPMPTATRRTTTTEGRTPTTEGRTTTTRRGSDLPDPGKTGDRPIGAKAGEPARGPDLIDPRSRASDRPIGAKTGEPARGPDLAEPRTPRVDAGRTEKLDSPAKAGKTTARGTDNPPGPTVRRGNETPGRDQQPPRIEQPRLPDVPRAQPPRSNDVPRVQPPKASDVPRVQPPTRTPDVPRVQPPRPSNDGPRIESPGRSGETPRVQPRDRGNDAPRGGGDRPTPSTNVPRASSPPPRIETPRATPRSDPPANRSTPSRSDQPNVRTSPPRSDGGASSRPSNSNSSPPSNSNNSNNNRGKGKDKKDN